MPEISTARSLGVILSTLAVTVAASWLKGRREWRDYSLGVPFEVARVVD